MSTTEPKGMSIGAVARVTGIAADTLRTWERRYQLVVPGRTASGRRVYSDAQVRRLHTIAALAERGERVADLAALDDEELAARARLHGGTAGPEVVRVVHIHPTPAPNLAGVVADGGVRLVVAAWARDASQVAALEGPFDVLVVDLGALGDSPAEALDDLLETLRPSATLLTYDFLSRPLRRRLSRPGLRMERGPLALEELRRRVADQALVRSDPPPRCPGEPLFTTPQLEQILNKSAELECECPNHLASLVLQLRAFERYSRGCENASAEDALLHAELAGGTAHAAHGMELLLARVVAHEGFDV